MMVTYALFETMEVLKFCFFMFDKDKNGFIHKVRIQNLSDGTLVFFKPVVWHVSQRAVLQDEFVLFVEMIHSRDSAPLSNVVSMVEQLDVDGDGKFTWLE
jgi:Ca2+-binding EF-hand superfamily protein